MTSKKSAQSKSEKSLRSLDELVEYELISSEEVANLIPVAQQYDVAITPIMADLIDNTNSHDPIAKQFLPSSKELISQSNERIDPIGDERHTKLKGLVHRYPDRCLLKPIGVCPVYCRFCFRREQVGIGSETMSVTDLNRAFEYIASHPEIWEVILTGGDPLILKPEKIAFIMEALAAIPHVDVMRIHTRIPVVAPQRITTRMVRALRTQKAVYVALHANHPKEFTSQAVEACAKLIDAGIPMLSQSVLLKGVNDDVATLTELMRTFVRHRIKPYYLHHADLAKGTQHFRTRIAEGQNLMRAIQGNISGLCQPTYVIDIPDGYGKVPIGPSYITEVDEECYAIEDYCGKKHLYQD